MPETSVPEQPDEKPFTAIVFVHGMGSQKRMQEVSQLVEVMERRAPHAARRDAEDGKVAVAGKLTTDPRIGVEQSNVEAGKNVSYIRTRWFPEGGHSHGGSPFRFYEAYWANVTAGGVPKLEVLKWMFQQPLKPISAMLTPWRYRQRQRRSVLAEMMHGDPLVNRADVGNLFRLYNDYDSDDARARYPQGDHEGFVKLVKSEWVEQSSTTTHTRDLPEEGQRLVGLARRWRNAYHRSEWKNLLILATIALSLVLVAYLAVVGVFQALVLYKGSDAERFDITSAPRFIADNRAVILLTLSSLLLVPGVASFLTGYLGDVQFWATYEETDEKYRKRREILECTTDTLRHVVAHPDCERIVVIAHSLGTPIAIDSILRLARENRAVPDDLATAGDEHRKARLRLRKITHVVTYGCPIDKIEYLFEETGEGRHRYNRVIEDLRGDIGTEPFADDDGHRLLHWVNFWDQADFISGPIESPVNREWPLLGVDNVQVKGPKLPNPGAGHNGYLDRYPVVDALVDVAFNRTSGRNSQDFSEGVGWWWMGLSQLAAVVVIWALVVFCAVVPFTIDRWVAATSWVALGLVGVGLVIFVATGWKSTLRKFAAFGRAIWFGLVRR